tara:strand:+ start:93 stop:1055 length:963 start_codon:yes stop_codon:yes gene_type:complete
LRKTALNIFLLILVIPLSISTPAVAAAVKVLPSKPAITAISPLGSGDQISDFTVNPKLIAVVGTVETGMTDLVTAPTLGGSDGFITALDKERNLLWNLRLGSSSDDIATAIAKDKAGFFWVTGATSRSLETSTAVLESSAINLDSISVDTVVTPKNTLTRLVLWKIGITGQLSQTYFYDVNGLVAPSTIALSGESLKITGNLSEESGTQQFTISADLDGNFSELKLGKISKIKPKAIETIKARKNKITSFISRTTIIDIPSWRAKKPTPVIVKFSKNRKALAANSLPGKVKKVLWQSGVGTVVLVQVNSNNQIHLLSNMS